MQISAATTGDAHAIAAIIVPVIRDGTTYALDPGMTEAAALAARPVRSIVPTPAMSTRW